MSRIIEQRVPDLGDFRDVEVIEMELILADMQSVDKQLDKAAKDAKGGDKDAKGRMDMLEKVKKTLDGGRSARMSGLSAEELKPFSLLTSKPILYLGNEDEGMDDDHQL